MTKYLLIGDGESPHILKWTRELVKYFEVYLVSSRNVLPQIMDLIPGKRVFTFDLRISESGGNFQVIKMIFPLARIMKKVRPDIVNAHYVTSHGVVTALAKKFSGSRFKLIQSAWGSDILIAPFRNGFYRQLTRFALKQASLATADSEFVAGIIRDLASVETMTFPFGLEKLPDVRPDEKDVNLFFSNRTLNSNSNIDRVLQFFSGIRAVNQYARLVIANDGPTRNELERLVQALDLEDAVTFTGFINQDAQHEYYLKAQYYFSILTSDALSVSLLEALAYGCIPLVSDLPDNNEWVKDGNNGVIMTEDTTPDILQGILEKARNIAEINRELIAEKAIFPKSMEVFRKKINQMEKKT